MAVDFADPARIQGYHAHVYYQPGSRAVAESLREALGSGFKVTLGRWHDGPVGPHTRAMYQVAFAVEHFADIVPWLMLNRTGLDILVHPLTGNDYDDHAEHALWLGTRLPLRLEILSREPHQD